MIGNKETYVSLVLVLIIFFAGGYHEVLALDKEKVKEQLDIALTDSVTDVNGNIYKNAVVYIEAPKENFIYANGAGLGRADSMENMTFDHQFHIMSITKTMTAVVILQLWEEGYFGEKGLDATLAELKIFPDGVISELHLINGVSHGREITIRHLLNHTSGVKSFTYDDEKGIAADYTNMPCAPDSFFGIFLMDTEKGLTALIRDSKEATPEGHDWTQYISQGRLPDGFDSSKYYPFYPPFSHWSYDAWLKDPKDKMAGLLNLYLSGMNKTAISVPGTEFRYTDTNYLLLGLLIEKITRNSLHRELRRRIFTPLEMNHTYMTYAVDPPASPWVDKLSDFWYDEFPVVSFGVNLSVNWSDAGIVSSVKDLNKFIRTLAKGKLFEDDATLAEMIKLPFGGEKGYGCGIHVEYTDDDTILAHSGGSGSWMVYYTKADVSYIGTINQSSGDSHRFHNLHNAVYQSLEDNGMKLTRVFEMPEAVDSNE